MSRAGAVIFDLDGTVVDSHAYTFDAIRHALVPYRAPVTDAEIFAAFGPPERAILGRFLAPESVAPAYARLQDYYATHLGRLTMHPALRALWRDSRQAGWKCGLFTGRGADSTRMILAALDLDSAFTAIVTGDDVRRPKPAPDGIDQLLEALGCRAPESLVVGDSPLDCAAARAAGAGAIFANWYAWSGADAPAGVPIAKHPDALRPFLGLASADPAPAS